MAKATGCSRADKQKADIQNRRAPVAPGHLGRRARLINEHKLFRLEIDLGVEPGLSSAEDISPHLDVQIIAKNGIPHDSKRLECAQIACPQHKLPPQGPPEATYFFDRAGFIVTSGGRVTLIWILGLSASDTKTSGRSAPAETGSPPVMNVTAGHAPLIEHDRYRAGGSVW